MTNLTFGIDYETIITGLSAWYDIEAVATRIVRTQEIKPRIGNWCLKVELRPEDRWNGTSRSELGVLQDVLGHPIWENESSGTQYYAFSVQFPLN